MEYLCLTLGIRKDTFNKVRIIATYSAFYFYL